jgi:hypothetical protein
MFVPISFPTGSHSVVIGGTGWDQMGTSNQDQLIEKQGNSLCHSQLYEILENHSSIFESLSRYFNSLKASDLRESLASLFLLRSPQWKTLLDLHL